MPLRGNRGLVGHDLTVGSQVDHLLLLARRVVHKHHMVVDRSSCRDPEHDRHQLQHPAILRVLLPCPQLVPLSGHCAHDAEPVLPAQPPHEVLSVLLDHPVCRSLLPLAEEVCPSKRHRYAVDVLARHFLRPLPQFVHRVCRD